MLSTIQLINKTFHRISYHPSISECSLNVVLMLQTLLHVFRIVGEDDGGVMFTPEEYEEYKKKVVPMVSCAH